MYHLNEYMQRNLVTAITNKVGWKVDGREE